MDPTAIPKRLRSQLIVVVPVGSAVALAACRWRPSGQLPRARLGVTDRRRAGKESYVQYSVVVCLAIYNQLRVVHAGTTIAGLSASTLSALAPRSLPSTACEEGDDDEAERERKAEPRELREEEPVDEDGERRDEWDQRHLERLDLGSKVVLDGHVEERDSGEKAVRPAQSLPC